MMSLGSEIRQMERIAKKEERVRLRGRLLQEIKKLIESNTKYYEYCISRHDSEGKTHGLWISESKDSAYDEIKKIIERVFGEAFSKGSVERVCDEN